MNNEVKTIEEQVNDLRLQVQKLQFDLVELYGVVNRMLGREIAYQKEELKKRGVDVDA